MQILAEHSLESLNTLALPGRCTGFAEVEDESALVELIASSRAEGRPVLPLGEGSNIVVAGDVDALVVRQAPRPYELLSEEGSIVRLRAYAGSNWHELVRATLSAGLRGLENLALIPGCVGAAPVQNIGAYGVELESLVERVHALDSVTGEVLELDRAGCEFRYSDSVFKQALRDRCVITAVDLQLSKDAAINMSYPAVAHELAEAGIDQPTARDVFEAVVAIRRRKLPDPAVEPNAGSFFKNPELPYEQAAYTRRLFMHMPCYNLPNGRVKVPAAWLIEQAGWKGVRRGAVGVHPGHALVMVHYGGGDGRDLLELADAIVESVEQQFHIRLEMEPRVYGAPRDGI